MSIDIMNRLWWHDFDAEVATLDPKAYPGSGRNLFWTLLPMADMAGEEGFCWPAVETVARKSRLTKRAVQMALKQAEALGILRRRHRRDASTQYVFVLERLPHLERPVRVKERGPIEYFEEAEPDLFGGGESHAPVNPMSMTGAQDSLTGESHAPRNTIEPPLEPPSLAMSDSDVAEMFVSKWNQLAADVPKIAAVNRLGEKRTKSLMARIAEYEPQREPEAVEKLIDRVIATIRGSRFLRGEERSFVTYSAWALTPTYFPKLEETGYAQDVDAGDGPRRAPEHRDRSNVAAGQEARDILHAGRGTARRSARELAGGYSRGSAGPH